MMIKKTYVKSRKVWKVNFKLPKEECPQDVKIKSVNLAGDFNDWKRNAVPMTLRNGIYSTTVELGPGQNYQFRYLINGKVWCNDWHADGYVPNSLGSDNCVVTLPMMNGK
ncbi:MAG: isoamylase early set domain-containing protein [Anaerolineales bacterium]|jgi:hypothetical protein